MSGGIALIAHHIRVALAESPFATPSLVCLEVVSIGASLRRTGSIIARLIIARLIARSIDARLPGAGLIAPGATIRPAAAAPLFFRRVVRPQHPFTLGVRRVGEAGPPIREFRKLAAQLAASASQFEKIPRGAI